MGRGLISIAMKIILSHIYIYILHLTRSSLRRYSCSSIHIYMYLYTSALERLSASMAEPHQLLYIYSYVSYIIHEFGRMTAHTKDVLLLLQLKVPEIPNPPKVTPSAFSHRIAQASCTCHRLPRPPRAFRKPFCIGPTRRCP